MSASSPQTSRGERSGDPPSSDSLLLVTGGTGLVGSHVVERAVQQGWNVRALVRSGSDLSFLQTQDVELVEGDLTQPSSLPAAIAGATHIVNCAAKVGDWGLVKEYRRVNVEGLRSLLDATLHEGAVRCFVQISSLGVYPAHHHYGTDETSPTSQGGIDGYTISKVESERLLLEYRRQSGLPGIALRPGWIYGSRDRTVMPELLKNLQRGKVLYLGSGKQLLNQIYVGNLIDAVFLALARPDLAGRVYNLTDGHLVTRIEFMETICRLANCDPPKKHLPLPVAYALAGVWENFYRFLNVKHPPLLSQARVKFLGLNLDYNIDRAREELKYQPRITFSEGMEQTIDWARKEGLIPHVEH